MPRRISLTFFGLVGINPLLRFTVRKAGEQKAFLNAKISLPAVGRKAGTWIDTDSVRKVQVRVWALVS